jgi:peptidoglycan/LPS O-acetylase OafA/YrhL
VRVSYDDGLLRWVLTSSPMLALGRISFSFFLVHVIVLGVISEMAAQYANRSRFSAAALALGAFLASIVVATVLYEAAETPDYLLRRHAARRQLSVSHEQGA